MSKMILKFLADNWVNTEALTKMGKSQEGRAVEEDPVLHGFPWRPRNQAFPGIQRDLVGTESEWLYPGHG